MLKFIVRRLFWTIPVLLVVIFLTFMMMRQIGGNPFRQSERAVPRRCSGTWSEVQRRQALVSAVPVLREG